ncbi:MAG TPA: aminotransferase class IV [Chitinophagaceae bacterium]|nr:aminotransferase class IV [Chitinophagaceae bacterium]
MLAFINNQYLEEDKAVLQVGDLAFQRGYAVFDFLKTINGTPLFLNDYIDRLFHSAFFMHLEPGFSKEGLKEIIFSLIRKNKTPDSGIKMLITGGYSTDGYQPGRPNLVVLQQILPILPSEKLVEGIKVISHSFQRELPEAKSINYLTGIWLQPLLKAKQAADVLYHQHGVVSEFPRANVFMVTKTGKIVTPSKGILQGITRKYLLELAKNKFETEVRDLHIGEIEDAAELFMTSTTKRLLPICQVDDILIGNGKPGPITTNLRESFIKFENEMI